MISYHKKKIQSLDNNLEAFLKYNTVYIIAIFKLDSANFYLYIDILLFIIIKMANSLRLNYLSSSLKLK